MDWEQYWTSPGGNTPQDTNYTATCLPSRKLYKLYEPDTQDTAGEARTISSVMYSYGPPHMAKQKRDDQLEHTYSSYVRIRDVALKTCQKRNDYDDDDLLLVILCQIQILRARVCLSHHHHHVGYLWPSLATSPYRSSPLAGLQGYIRYLT